MAWLRGSLGALVLGALLSQPFSPTTKFSPEPKPLSTFDAALERPIPRPTRTRVSRSQPRPAPQPRWAYVRSREAILRCIRRAEGSSWTSVSPSGKYRGAYQFDRSTWDGVARRVAPPYVGLDPAKASPKVQSFIAWALYKDRGFQPWPPAMRRCRAQFSRS